MTKEGYEAPTKENDGAKKAKRISKWNELEFVNLNFKALSTRINGLTRMEFYKVMDITCAKELWDYIEITHKGTSEVKKSKINMLVKDFEILFIKSNEFINEFFNEFKEITNEFQALGKDITSAEMNKVWRSLPRNGIPLSILLRWCKISNTLKFQELMEILKNVEIKLKAQRQSDEVEASNARKRLGLKDICDGSYSREWISTW